MNGIAVVVFSSACVEEVDLVVVYLYNAKVVNDFVRDASVERLDEPDYVATLQFRNPVSDVLRG